MRLFIALIAVVMLLAGAAVPALAGEPSVSGSLVEVLHQKGVLDDASYNELKKAGEEGGQALDRKLIEVLHQKGVLDDVSYGRLAGQAEKEGRTAAAAPAAPPVPQASTAAEKPAGEARPLEQTLASAEEGIARLSGDRVKLRIGSWLQLGWVNDDSGSSTYFPGVKSALSGTAGNQFFARYARLYFNGMLSDKIGFRIMFDAAPTSATVFRDAYVYFDYIPYARITLGQYLTPFGDEVWRAPFEVPVINYALASTFIQVPTARSLGVMLSGKYKTDVKGMPFGAGYAVSFINGLVDASASTGTDDNDAKDLIGRAWVNPFIPGLSVGGSWYVGKTRHTIGTAELNEDHARWAAELDYAPAFANGLTLRGEYLWQRRFFTTGGINRLAHSSGWYATAAYRVNGLPGGLRYLNDLEPLVRYEEFDEDTALPDNNRTRTTVGLNYYLNKYARLMLNYEIIHADEALKAFTLQGYDNSNVNHNVFTTTVQVWF